MNLFDRWSCRVPSISTRAKLTISYIHGSALVCSPRLEKNGFIDERYELRMRSQRWLFSMNKFIGRFWRQYGTNTHSFSFFAIHFSLHDFNDSPDFDANIPFQNSGRFYWCVPRTKCGFGYKIKPRSEQRRRLQSIQIHYVVHPGHYLW